MPGILKALSRDEAVALTDLAGAPPSESRPDNVASLAHAAAKRQQRSRRTWLAAAVASAAALLIAGAVVGATVFPQSSAPTQTVAMQAMQPTPRGGLTAELAVTEKKWGRSWAGRPLPGLVEERRQLRHRGDDRRRRAETWGSWKPAGDEATGLSAATHPGLTDSPGRHPRDRSNEP
jgi:hypothetical protein